MLNNTLVFDAIVIVLFATAIPSIAFPSISSAQNMTEDKISSEVSPEIAMLPAEDNMNGSVTNQTITEGISPNTATTIDNQSTGPDS
jgi:hypothetical protein